jgi:hypothetical protein
MHPVIIGSQAIARGDLTRGQLRWRYEQLFPDVWVERDVPRTLAVRTSGAFLWSRGSGVVTGRAAAAMHGARWVADDAPVELIAKKYDAPAGIIARDERVTDAEFADLGGLAVATPERCAYDLGRHLPRRAALIHLDALARASGVRAPAVARLSDRHRGARGVRRLRSLLPLVDAGAQSPKETLLRLQLIDAGFPPPRTQIPVVDDHGRIFAHLDMGWERPMIAVEYDGDHHRTDRAQYVWDERRLRMLRALGWLHIRVLAEDRFADIVERVRRAWREREPRPTAV